jgi:ABC-type sulfate transport system permease subunit
MRISTHLKFIGALHTLAGITALTLFLFFFDAMVSLIGEVPTYLLLLVAVPQMIAGYAVIAHQKWARVAAMISGAVSLILVPVGTALGIYTISILTRNTEEGNKELTDIPN